MKIKFGTANLPSSGTLVLFAATGAKLTPLAEKADAAANGHIAKALAAAKFEGNREQVLDLLVPSANGIRRVLVAGIGDSAKLTTRDLEYVGGTIAGALQTAKLTEATLAADLPTPKTIGSAEAAARLGSGMRAADLRVSQIQVETAEGPLGREGHHDPDRRPEGGAARVPGSRGGGAGRAPGARPGQRACQHAVSDRIRQARQGPRKRRPQGGNPRTQGAEPAEDGRPSRRGAGIGARAADGRHAVAGRQEGRHRRSHSSARASPSIPAAFPSSPPKGWRT